MPPPRWRCEVVRSAPSRAPKPLEPLLRHRRPGRRARRGNGLSAEIRFDMRSHTRLESLVASPQSNHGQASTAFDLPKVGLSVVFTVAERYIQKVVKSNGGQLLPGGCRFLQEGANL